MLNKYNVVNLSYSYSFMAFNSTLQYITLSVSQSLIQLVFDKRVSFLCSYGLRLNWQFVISNLRIGDFNPLGQSVSH